VRSCIDTAIVRAVWCGAVSMRLTAVERGGWWSRDSSAGVRGLALRLRASIAVEAVYGQGCGGGSGGEQHSRGKLTACGYGCRCVGCVVFAWLL
jgi:hypothetical protein